MASFASICHHGWRTQATWTKISSRVTLPCLPIIIKLDEIDEAQTFVYFEFKIFGILLKIQHPCQIQRGSLLASWDA